MRRCTRNIGDIKADFLHESRPKIIWSYYVLSTNVSVLINEKAGSVKEFSQNGLQALA